MVFRYRHGDRPLEGYTILRGIGRGGFGEVYYAVSDGGREVALKLIQQNHEIELRGVRQCMNLKNPHLVTIFDVHPNGEGTPFVIMEHVKGPSLREIIRATPSGLPPAEAAFFVREIARGLSYIHEHAIVHRDLKPENIFFEDGYVKIGDYGLSKYISVSRHSGQTISVGTVHYMAPEIGSGNYHRTIDIYALGVIAYELLTGRVPFDGDTMGEILMKHLTCEPDVAALPANLQPVVKKALAKSPTERYGKVEELVSDLLGDAGFAAEVAAFRPSGYPAAGAVAAVDPARPTISVSPAPGVTAELGAAAAELGVAAAELGAAARRASPPPPVAAPAPAHEPVAPGSSPAEVGRGVFWSRDIGLRVFLALATAVAMALPIGLITGSRTEEGILYLLAILAGAVPLFLVEAWAAPRFELETGLARRLMGLACAGPLVALVTSAEREIWENVVALLTGLVLIDWSERVKPRRHERVSLHLAFTAGLCGFVVGLIATGGDGDNALAAGGTLAGMSLVLNALAPFSGEAHRRDWRWRNHEAEWGRAPRAEGRPNPLAAAAAAPAARPPPAPLHAAPALAASSTGVGKRLLRPREERLLAGVCAGLAARFGIDVAWVRLAFIFAAFVPGGLLLYLALWISMPAVGKRVTVVPSYAATRPGWLRRSLWGLASVAALVGAVIAVAVASEERTWNDDFIFACGFTVFFSLFALLCLVKAVRRVRGTFFRGTVLPVAVIVLASIATSCTLACLTLGLRPDEFAVTAAVAIACGGLALFLSRLILGSVERRMRIDYAAAHPEAGFAHAGWLAFGMLFMILALAVLAGGTVFAVGAVEVLLGPPEYPWPTPLVHFGKQHEHLALALVFFLPGLFALLMSRRKGGPAHVVRGAIGWIAAGLLSGFLSLGLMETLRVSRSADSRFQVQQVRRVHEMDQGIAIMVGLLAVSAVALAWPARAGEAVAGHGAVAADGGEQW